MTKKGLDTIAYKTADSVFQAKEPVFHSFDGIGIKEPILPRVTEAAKEIDTSIFASSFPPMLLEFVILIILASILGCFAQVYRHYREERTKYIKKVVKAKNLKDKDVSV